MKRIPQKKVIVISLGGSVVLSEELDQSFFSTFKEFIINLSKTWKIFLVIGGGKTARTYIQMGRNQEVSETNLDWLGIHATRLNALFLSILLNSTTSRIPPTVEEAFESEEDIVIMGGTTPGHSTDYVGAELSSKSDASYYIIATNVDGVYDRDPGKYPDAKHLSEVSIDTLLKDHGNHWEAAGKNTVIDGPALQHIKDHTIPTFVVDGRSIEDIKHIINDEPFRGTRIRNENKNKEMNCP